ncbi:MAG TPA: DUF58 domain-containing protein [Arcobacter sp.]|jgi:uncharacterized protein (DUF58 family)|nr:DUF58 domain-containing protein [Arcobacter sp.]
MYYEIEEIIFQTKKKFFSKIHGEHRSIFLGSGLEFNEIRQYTIDDDIRHINWKTTAKTKDPSVNIYYENKKLDICLVYLCSGSLQFGSSIQKKQIASVLLCSLSYLAVEKKDNVTTLFFDNKEREYCKANREKYLPYRLFEDSKKLHFDYSVINYNMLNETIMNKIKSRSLLFIIGDFLEIPFLDDIASRYEVYILILRDKDEEILSLEGEYNLKDTNQNRTYQTNITSQIIKEYNNQMKKHDIQLYEYFENLDFKYTKIYTNEDPISALEKFLKEIHNGE